MIVLIERCRDVIRYNYIKVMTELIRMMIFYDDYDSNPTSKVFDTSVNGRKVTDSIIISIKKCVNLLKDIDSSLCNTIIDALNYDVVSVIRKYILFT